MTIGIFRSLDKIMTDHMDTSPEHKRVLVVDDDDELSSLLAEIMRSQNWEVTTAQNGRIAQQILKTTSFDLVISDIQMPETNGIELTRLIKKGNKKTPVILITAFHELLETHEAHSAGADEFVPKPFTSEDILLAVARCQGKAAEKETKESDYCRVAIHDFVSGRQINYSIYLRLSAEKFVKIAHRGEDLSTERIQLYKTKGVKHLYLHLDDFRRYVGFQINVLKMTKDGPTITEEEKRELVTRTHELVQEQIRREGIDPNNFDSASEFVETMISLIADDADLYDILKSLNSHTDYLYAHSLGVSVYGVLIAQNVGWHLPTNKFKVALGGLLHDVGHREIDVDLLSKPRRNWSLDELNRYEQHPLRGIDIVKQLPNIASDVSQIIKEHHESCTGKGYPNSIRRSMIHPMAKLIAVVDEFCELVISNPDSPGMSPKEAIERMFSLDTEKFDAHFLEALIKVCKVPIPEKLRSTRMV